MRYNRKRARQAMHWNGRLLEELVSSMEGYDDLLEGIEDGELDHVDRRAALSLAKFSSMLLRKVTFAAGDYAETLGAPASPMRAIEHLEVIAECAIVVLAEGPDSELAPSSEELHGRLGEPFTVHWMHLVYDGPDSKEELAEVHSMHESRPAEPAEIEVVRADVRDALGELAARYEVLYAGRPDGGPAAPQIADEALSLATRLALLLRSAQQDDRDVRSYPDEIAYALGVVLPAVFQSLVIIAAEDRTSDDLLTDTFFRELLDGPFIPELLAGT